MDTEECPGWRWYREPPFGAPLLATPVVEILCVHRVSVVHFGVPTAWFRLSHHRLVAAFTSIAGCVRLVPIRVSSVFHPWLKNASGDKNQKPEAGFAH